MILSSINYSRKIIKNLKVIILLSPIILGSCDCAYNYEFKIQNRTNSRIQIYCKAGYLNSDAIEKTVFLKRDSTTTIYKVNNFFPGGGCPGPWKEDGRYLIDSIYISMNDTMETILNYRDIDNWMYTDSKLKGTFKVSLTNDDFERIK
jgi:hypothetical protein